MLQPIESGFDAPAQPVETLAEAKRLVPVAAVWDDRFGCMLVQFLAQLGTVIRFVAEHAFGAPHSADQAIGNWTIVRFACGQQDGDQASFICECMNLRVAPCARAANSLLLLPPFSAGCRAVGFHMRGVDHLRVCGSSRSGKLSEQIFPDAAPCPAN